MFDRKLLSSRLIEIGCRSAGPLKYTLPGSNPKITWSLTFRLLGVYRWEVDGGVQWHHSEASPFARRCLELFAGDWWRDFVQREKEFQGGGGFPIAKLAPWGITHALKIRDLSAEDSAARITSDTAQYILPFVRGIGTDQDFHALLLRDEPPAQWLFGQPLLRFAELAFMTAKLGKPNQLLDAVRHEQRQFLAGQLHDQSFEQYVEQVLHAASDA